MACAPSPTATEYATITTFTPSTSFSQSAATNQPQLTTIVQQSCVVSGTINGSSVGCISSAQVAQVNTVGGNAQAAQVPIVVSVAVVATQPTQTLFAPCSSDGGSPSTSRSSVQIPVQTPSDTPVTTTILVESTPSPSTVVEASSTTLADGSVVQTVVTMVTTLPPTSIYLPTSLSSPTLQNHASQGSGTNVAPIVGGVLGGFLGLVAIVGFLWWLCRRRRSWDDIFEKEDLQNDDAWVPPVRRERGDRRRSSLEPRPYQYGLVGRVIPPAAAGDPTRSSQYGSVSEHSGAHSRNTSLSATPLLQANRTSRPSTAGSIPAAQTHPGSRVPPTNGIETEPRSSSMTSHSNSAAPLLDSRSTPALLDAWTPNMDELAVLEPLVRTGSPIPSAERRILHIANEGPPSPTGSVPPGPPRTSSGPSPDVIMHTDGGRVPESDPPAYSR